MKHPFFSILLTALIVMFANATTAQAQSSQKNNKGIVLFVEFTFDAKDMNKALELLNEMQMQVLEKEEGCIAYDLLMSNESPNKVFIYESYDNKEDLNKHKSSPYFKDIIERKLPKYIKSSKVMTMYPLNQNEGGESNENPHTEP